MAATTETLTDAVPGLENISCQPCSRNKLDKSAAKYCLDCEVYQCDDCVKSHQLFSVTKCHTILDYCEKELPQYDMKGLDYCKQHDRRLEMFCEEENMPCCSTCAVFNHRRCQSVEEMKLIVGQRQTNWTGVQQGITEIETKAKEVVKHVNDQRTQLSEGSSNIQSKVLSTQDKVNNLFDNLKKTVGFEIKSFQEKSFEGLNEMEKTFQTLVSKVKQTRTDINDISHRGMEVQQLIFAKHVSGLISDYDKSIDMLSDEMKDVRLTFEYEDSLKLPPTKQQFWKIRLYSEKRNENIQGDATDRETERVGHGICDKNMQVICQTGDSAKEQKNISLKCFASLDLKQKDENSTGPFYCGLDFLPDGRLVAVDFNNKKCVLYNPQSEHISRLQLSYIPYDVAVLSATDIIITSGGHKRLYTYKIEKSNSIVEAKYVNVSVNCDCISVVDEHTVCVGTFDNEDCKVLFLSLQSGRRKLFYLFWTMYYGIDYRFRFPTECYSIEYHSCKYIQKIAKIVFTDRSTDTVYIQDIATNQLVTVKDEVIKGPRRVAGGPDDTIFILCSKNNSLVHITQTGQVLGLHSIDVDGTYSICSSPNRRMLAISNSCSGKKNCTIYEISEVQRDSDHKSVHG